MISKIFGVFLFVLGTLLFFDGVMGLINCPNTFANIVGFLLIPTYISLVYWIVKYIINKINKETK